MNLTPSREPVAYSTALVAILNALVLLGVIDLTPDQIAAMNVAFVSVLAIVVRQNVTPV